MVKYDKEKALEYHKQQMHTYRTIDSIKHSSNFKAVIIGGEVAIKEKEEK